VFVVRAAHQQITRAPSLADVPGAALSSFRLCRRECDRFGRIALDDSVEQGNPPDAQQLVKKRAGRTPRIVTAARGYGEAEVDRQLTDLGIANVVIPRKARPTQARRARGTRPRGPCPFGAGPVRRVCRIWSVAAGGRSTSVGHHVVRRRRRAQLQGSYRSPAQSASSRCARRASRPLAPIGPDEPHLAACHR
jgi:IS5 family transposase